MIVPPYSYVISMESMLDPPLENIQAGFENLLRIEAESLNVLDPGLAGLFQLLLIRYTKRLFALIQYGYVDVAADRFVQEQSLGKTVLRHIADPILDRGVDTRQPDFLPFHKDLALCGGILSEQTLGKFRTP